MMLLQLNLYYDTLSCTYLLNSGFIDYGKLLLIILSKRLTLFSAERSKLMKVTMAASEKESAAEVLQEKSRCSSFLSAEVRFTLKL